MEIDEGTERRIVTGLIVSTSFIQQVREIFDTSLLEAKPAKHLANWCLEYYDIYNKAPFKDIEGILYNRLRNGEISDDMGEEIDQDILPDLDKDYTNNNFNVDALRDETKLYIRLQRANRFNRQLKDDLAKGKVDDAEKKIATYSPIAEERGNELEIPGSQFQKRLKLAFDTSYESVLKYPGALGQMFNPHLVRGGLIGLLGRNKIGKTFIILDMAVRGLKQGSSVAFFQAGDMTEQQQLIRGGIYLTRKPFLEEQTGVMWEPVKDCIWNQTDSCDKKERGCDFGLYESKKEDLSDYYDWRTLTNLKDAYHKSPDYNPCFNCEKWKHNSWGAPFIKSVEVNSALTYNEALDAYNNFFKKSGSRWKLATYSNGTLSVPMIEAKLNLWKKQDDYQPDIILIDYSDLLVSQNSGDFRHGQNDIWQGLRRISQDWHCLVITPTQADSKSFSKGLLKSDNFTEDRRKLDHATAIYGLNRDAKGVEKEIGLLRINEIVVREGYFSENRQVIVLQNLRRGRPFLGSFWHKK